MAVYMHYKIVHCPLFLSPSYQQILLLSVAGHLDLLHPEGLKLWLPGVEAFSLQSLYTQQVKLRSPKQWFKLCY